jgi:hypothetical protein
MKAIEADRTPQALLMNASIETIFGQERYLEKVTDTLYANQIRNAVDLVAMSEFEFRGLFGRITNQNVQRVKRRLKELRLSFKSN